MTGATGLAAFTSHQFELAIDADCRVSIVGPPPAARMAALFSMPLAALGLDRWAVELGGRAMDVAPDVSARALVRAMERPYWRVP